MSKDKKLINEGLYDESITERIHPELEEALRKGKHSLAECGVFPEGDIISSEMKLIRERFKDVVLRCREAFDMDKINNKVIMAQQMPLVMGTMEMEQPHKEKLEELAIKMVKEEFDIPDDAVIFEAELTGKIDRNGTNDVPMESLDEEFNDHEEIVRANAEVKKRRAINAMIQGSAKKVNHMFHMVHEELSNLNPRLPNMYKKTMSAADYMYFIVPDLGNAVNGGSCDTTNDENDGRPVIKAKGMVFPVLIHELCKGVMEVLSSHGLPVQENIAKYVIEKADFVQAEPWDMRLGPAMWGRFCEAIPADDFGLKHHVYMEMAQMEPNQFNNIMKEILAKTKKGKMLVNEILERVKEEIRIDEYNERMNGRDDLFGMDELL